MYNPAMRAAAKLILNSIYGRTLMRERETETKLMTAAQRVEFAKTADFEERLRAKVIVEGARRTALFAPPTFDAVGFDALAPQALILPIANISDVWFLPGGGPADLVTFGVTLSVTQAVVWPPPAMPSIHNFVGLTLP